MKLTRTHFKRLASIVSRVECPHTRRLFAVLLLPMLKDSNPRFQEAKFLAACGVSK